MDHFAHFLVITFATVLVQENYAACPPGQVQCGDDQHDCVNALFICDGRWDCSNDWDESNCQNKTCHPKKMKCQDNEQCIWKEWAAIPRLETVTMALMKMTVKT